MKWSAISRRVDAGFTLIELVIALAVVGLGLSFALPKLSSWVDRLAFSMRQQRFEDALAGLGSRARRSGQTIVLRSTGLAGSATEPLPIDVPTGWSLTVEPPISFRYDGMCAGGTVRLSSPAGERVYRLQPPYCRPEAL